ncbi:MAG: RnfABCDGE type electron transport complex subunit B [Clostridia bacterium]|nr:RnfABCDGE type electron transport complex subunit B [Clostridia bacterium]
MIFGIIMSMAILCIIAIVAAVFQNAEYNGNKIKHELKRERILECLPGSNCGVCGHSDCASYALAVAKGNASANACVPGGASVAQSIGVILGNEEDNAVSMRAQVMCSGSNSYARAKYIYEDGAADCLAEMKLGGGDKGCRYACVGLGNCKRACPFDAISIKNGVAYVDYRLCTGCGTCVEACPKGIIKLIPYDAYHWVGCASRDGIGKSNYNCKVGCTGCGICVKSCPEKAISVSNNIASINYEKCTGCGMCYSVCPEGIIWRSDIEGADGLVFNMGTRKH